ncbi:MAG TPA: hypothetical protein VLO09_04085 [Ornithinimicrobium sp.]|nr:hypothetical protein [Ornithinimicrobium sp.]
MVTTTADGAVGLPVVSRLRRYPQPAARLALRALGLASLGARHGVRLHRVLYPTTGVDGRVTLASGLVATPEGARPHAVVSYQHATQTHRLHVPSAPHRLEGVMASLAFAGAGYVFVAPDYLGMGSSPGQHPYLHTATEAAAVVDLLAVLPQVLGEVGTPVPERAALLGFSQGGHASLAALAELGRRPTAFEVVAVASVAGAHRLAETVGPTVLSGRSPHHTTYLAALATSYARVYGQPLASIVRERWARRLPILLDGSRGSMEVELALPRDPTHLLVRATVEDLCGPRDGWFARRLAENSVGDVQTCAPVRFYVGGQDVDAPAEDAHRAAGLVRANGGRAQVVHVGAVDHKGTALAAVGLTREWFDEVLGIGFDEVLDVDPLPVGVAAAAEGAVRTRTSRLVPVHLPGHLSGRLTDHLPLDRFRARSA